MTPNPLSGETEARREGSWWRVYGPPIICTVMFCGLVGFLGFLSYRSTHPKRVIPDPIPSNWSLHNQDKSIEVRGSVPGGVYSDLMNATVLDKGDFYYRFNDVDYRWVALNNWTYSTTFDVDPDLITHERVALIFDGLDTVAEVVLNGDVIGTTNNMFVRYVFDVKSQLQSATEVTLDVKFESPVAYAERIYEQQFEDYLVPPKCVPREYEGECHANHIRKMQASFAWDWGPAFPNMGIWKPWRLVGFDSLLVSDILFSATPTSALPNEPDLNLKPGWDVTVQVVFDAAVKTGTMAGNLNITLGNVYSFKNSTEVNIQDFQGTATSTFYIEEGEVDLWWPNGYGPQPLYALSAIWSDVAVSETTKTVRVGFRTVELNQDFVDPDNTSLGRHYRVHVNNVTMFMKGSNWIPAHVLPEMVSEQYTKELLEAAKQTHQNCIRVWGGGIYESDVFYETADELGILIWEDFMFACSMYPVSQPFLDTVVDEVKTQVRRLQHHPSILLWAANNENEAALRGNWYGTRPDFDRYKSDYITLYVNTIRNVTENLDSSRPFVVSSPNNGIESEEEGYIAQHPYNNLYGDVHYYNYFSDAWNWKIYPPTRFASEYGFQSWPSFRSMKDVTNEYDWSSTSALSYHRQHHPGGQAELALQIGLHMHLPPEDGSPKSYEYYLYLTQIHQAVAIKTETEFYRRGMSSINEKGEGYISGALYWQLNDIWQGASWASIEYGGRWKMLHYFAEKFFSPILTSLYVDNDDLAVTIINDSFEPATNLLLRIDLYRYDNMEKVLPLEKYVNATPSEANIVVQYNLWDDLELETHCQEQLYDEVDVCFVVSSLLDSNGTPVAPDNYLFLGKPKDANLLHATLEITAISDPVGTERSNWTFTVTITSDVVALFVWLEVDEAGVFSDNGFLMLDKEVDIEFYAYQETTVDSLHESLNVKSLTETYTEETVTEARAMAVMRRALHPNDLRNWLFV